MFAAGVAALVGLILLSSSNAQAAEKKFGTVTKGKHGRSIINFTTENTFLFTNKTGKNVYRVDVVETPKELAAKVSKKLGRQISEGILMLATLMASEAGDQSDRARIAIAHAAITYARRKYK